MILIRKGDIVDFARCIIGIGKKVSISGNKALPFEIRWYALGGSKHVSIHRLVSLGLTAYKLIERCQGLLNHFNYVVLK